ncbi:testis-expressed protein 12 [Mantella aurantiaca]
MEESSACQDESKKCKRKKDMEVLDSEMLQYGLQSHGPSCDSDLSPGGGFDAVLKDIKQEIHVYFSKYAKTLSDQSALDKHYVEEFGEIVQEAKSVETHLKQKRENLRSQLTMIANTLQK